MACERALKEWSVLVDALAAGDQFILLRKGGIADVGGEFHLETSQFVLWPTWLHQDAELLRPEHAARLAAANARQLPDGDVDVTVWAEVTSIVEVPARESLDALADEHVWSSAYLDQRWRYRPDLPLYLLLLRAHQLAAPIRLAELPAWRGCRSWIDLEPPLVLPAMTPVLAQAEFEARAASIRATVCEPAKGR